MPKEIKVTSTSTLELKAQIFQKQKELQTTTTGYKKKSNKPLVNNGVEERRKKDVDITIDRNSTKYVEESLKKKADLYEKLKKGSVSFDDLTEKQREDIMVDFQNEIFEDEVDYKNHHPKEDWVEFTDEFGRSRVMKRNDYEAMIKERETAHETELLLEQKKKQEEEEYETMLSEPAKAQFYDEKKEIRTKGVSYYKFSLDENERLEQKQQLDLIRQQTVERREIAQKLKRLRKERIENRLKKLQNNRTTEEQKTMSFIDKLPMDPPEEEEYQ